MAITKTGQQLINEAVARWKDFIQNMSTTNRMRLIDSGVVKSQDAYINGINRGTVNILNRYGYTRANIHAMTPMQVKRAKQTTQAQYAKAKAQNDQIGITRNADALSNQNIYNNFGYNPIAPRGGNITDWGRSVSLPFGKTTHTGGMSLPQEIMTNEGKRFFNAMISRHEALEASAAEKNIRRYLENPKKYDPIVIAAERKINPHARHYTDQEIISNLPLVDRALLSSKTPGRLKTNANIRKSSHADISVLGKERKLMDTFPYKDNDGYDFFRKMRDREYEYMDRAGEYQVKQHPGLISRFLMKLHLKKGVRGTLERYNQHNFRKMTSKMKQKTPVQMGKGETWAPLY